MELFGEHLALGTGIFLILALLMALSFEFVNGFHDTANAVATVIYTHSLRPVVAVVWSGFCNLMGVLMSSGAVAFGIVALLPVELVLRSEIFFWLGFSRSRFVSFSALQLSRPDSSLCSIYSIGGE